MSEKSKKESKKECPVPQEIRDKIKDCAETFDKHKKILKKFNPLD